MAHLMPELRHRVIVGKHLSVRSALLQLMGIKCDVAIASCGRTLRWPILHLVRSHVYGLHVPPLESASGTIRFQIMLVLPGSEHIAALRTVTGRAGLLIVNAEVGIVSEEIESVAERLDHRAGKILRACQ